jgi:Predicted redox protein, regulator of disulfide bond formation
MTASAPTLIRDYEISAQSTSIFGRVLCSARTHHFIVDGPVQNGCPGEEVTPPELFLSSVAACGVELVHVIAKDEKIAIDSVTVRVRGTVDRGNQPRPNVTTFNRVQLDFVITGTDDKHAAALVEGFKRR